MLALVEVERNLNNATEKNNVEFLMLNDAKAIQCKNCVAFFMKQFITNLTQF